MKLTKEELLAKLRECDECADTEGAHCEADDALLDYIDDPEIREAYERIDKWYA